MKKTSNIKQESNIGKRNEPILTYIFELLAKEGWITEREKNEIKNKYINETEYL